MVVALVMFTQDILFRLILEIIGFSSPSKDAAIAALVMFGMIGAIVILLSIGISICSCVLKRSLAAGLAWILQIVITLLYFYGKNMNAIMLRYGIFIGCHENCQRINHYFTLSSLVLAILFLTYAIPELHNMMPNSKNDHQRWLYLLRVIFIFVNANAIYSTLSIVPPDISCSTYAVVLSTVCLILISIVGGIKIILFSLNHSYLSSIFYSLIHNVVIHVIWCLALPIYLLSDNQLPLEYISCHQPNSTNDYTKLVGGTVIDHVIRFVGTFITGVALIVTLASFLCHYLYNKRKSRNRVTPIKNTTK